METGEKALKLPYSFAKSYGIVVGEMINNHTNVYHLPGASLQALAEVHRVLQTELSLIPVDESAFQQHLAHIYQSSSSVLDAAGGMEEDMDLSLLASQLPVSEDLLENQDDAPIIRLLNALFTQAIKQKASDIHIERSHSLDRYLSKQTKNLPLTCYNLPIEKRKDVLEVSPSIASDSAETKPTESKRVTGLGSGLRGLQPYSIARSFAP